MGIFRSVMATATAAGVVVFAGGVGVAAAAPSTCPARAGKQPGAKDAALFTSGRSLYACLSRREVRRLGPWTPGASKISADGDHSLAVWTVRVGGRDRVWASRDARAWLRGVPASPGPLGAIDGTVASLRANWLFTAWVTEGGQVVSAVDRPPVGSARSATPVFSEVDYDEYAFNRTASPAVVAGGTFDRPLPGLAPASSDPNAALKGVRRAVAYLEPTGLLAPNTSAPTEVIGRWPAEAGRRFAQSLRIEDLSDDEIGAFVTSVEPIEGQPRVGWATEYDRFSNDASAE